MQPKIMQTGWASHVLWMHKGKHEAYVQETTRNNMPINDTLSLQESLCDKTNKWTPYLNKTNSYSGLLLILEIFVNYKIHISFYFHLATCTQSCNGGRCVQPNRCYCQNGQMSQNCPLTRKYILCA